MHNWCFIRCIRGGHRIFLLGGDATGEKWACLMFTFIGMINLTMVVNLKNIKFDNFVLIVLMQKV